MSVEAITLALHHSRATGTAKVVMVGIANHDGDGGAWPALATLADYANVSRDNARKAVRRLEELGEIVVELQAGGTRNQPDHERPNRYRIMLRCPVDCDGTTAHRTRRKIDRIGPAPLIDSEGPSESRGAANPMGDPPSVAMPKPSSQPSTNTSSVPSVGNRGGASAPLHPATRGDRLPHDVEFASACDHPLADHRYSRRLGCCADCSVGLVPRAANPERNHA